MTPSIVLSLFPLLALSVSASPVPAPQSTSYAAPQVDNEAGGSGGSNSGYSISTGGIVAIIVIVALVAIFGITSAILFFIAKKRGWEVRKSIKRMSRRLTGRGGATSPTAAQKQARRGAVRMGSATEITRKDRTTGRAVEAVTKQEKRPREEIEVQDTTAVPGADGKRWKAMLPPGWSIGGKNP